jgi:hypothetical protein
LDFDKKQGTLNPAIIRLSQGDQIDTSAVYLKYAETTHIVGILFSRFLVFMLAKKWDGLRLCDFYKLIWSPCLFSLEGRFVFCILYFV